MVAAGLSIKLRCASWQQLATIYKRDLSKGTMFLKAASRPPLGTKVRIDLTLPSASVIALSGVVTQHVSDSVRGTGVDLQLDPLPSSSVWLIESALASEIKTGRAQTSPGAEMALSEAAEVASAEQDLVKALVAESESLKKLNPFLVLGVGYEASDADVRGAFGELTKRYHPDRFARYESKDLRAVAAEIFILIRDAYRKLGDEASRAQALAQLGKSSAPRAVPSKPPATPPAIPSIVRPGQSARPGAVRAQTEPGGVPITTGATPPPPPGARIPGRAQTEPGAIRPGPPPPPGPAVRPTPPPAAGTGSVPVLVTRDGTGSVAVIPAAGSSAQRAQQPAAQRADEHEAMTSIPGRGDGPAMGQMPMSPTSPTPAQLASRAITPPLGNPATATGVGLDDQPTLNPAQRGTAPTTPAPSARPPSAPPHSPGTQPPTPVTAPSRSQAPPPPPPMPETGRPVVTQPPPIIAIAESGDTNALDDLLDAGRFDDALAAYKLLTKKHPTDRSFRAGIELCEGLRALANRDRLEAAQRFEAALEIDPSSERAARELAEMRRQATNERKGLLSRLMGKKEG